MLRKLDKIDPDAAHYIATRTLTPVYDTCKQGKFCKGKCDRISINRPCVPDPYKEYCMCRRCNVWMKKSILIKERCPCCNFRPKMKSYRKR